MKGFEIIRNGGEQMRIGADDGRCWSCSTILTGSALQISMPASRSMLLILNEFYIFADEKDFYKGVILLVSRDYPALHL